MLIDIKLKSFLSVNKSINALLILKELLGSVKINKAFLFLYSNNIIKVLIQIIKGIRLLLSNFLVPFFVIFIERLKKERLIKENKRQRIKKRVSKLEF